MNRSCLAHGRQDVIVGRLKGMKFKNIKILNFRNFENINITLDNKNVFFGMNDVGKTNFLYALRYVFDREIRKNNLVDTDFYQRKTSTPIEITICIDISDTTDSDSEKLRAKVKGALLSNQDLVYIKLEAHYNQTEMFANPILYWGGDEADLQEIKAKGYSFELDYVFNVIYIDAFVDLYSLFKRNTAKLLKNDEDVDKEKLAQIDSTIATLNTSIADLSGIKKFESRVTPEYNSFHHGNAAVSVKSEIAINGLYSNVVPYIKKEGSDDLYPTSGEGRKKLLVYSIYDLLAEETSEKKINIFLIEEPENHLHRAMQLALSRRIFVGENYKYTFITTHSSFVLADMDNVNLVRIHNETKIDSASSFYTVPGEFEKQKQRLNKGLSEAIFADKVLLVEGPSEEALFGKVLSTKNGFYEADGIYILQAGGFGFKLYINILKQLKIRCVVKTDNDLRKSKGHSDYSVIGFTRINGLIEQERLPKDRISDNTVEAKRELYDANKTDLDSIREEYQVYLSRVSLEEDLDEVLHDEMVQYLPEANGDVIGYLQESKKYHMVELVEKLTDEDCEKIYQHYNFACLEDIMR